jgi:hypothetical protein
METPRDKFVKMMDDFDATHNQWLRKIIFFFGRRLKKMNNPIGRFIVSKITTQFSAYMIVEKQLFGVDKSQNETVHDIALNWLKLSIFFRIPTIVGEVTENSVEILRPECTVGFKEPTDCKICRASMNMDLAIVRRLGGKLTVTGTILEGAPMCRHIIVKA